MCVCVYDAGAGMCVCVCVCDGGAGGVACGGVYGVCGIYVYVMCVCL